MIGGWWTVDKYYTVYYYTSISAFLLSLNFQNVVRRNTYAPVIKEIYTVICHMDTTASNPQTETPKPPDPESREPPTSLAELREAPIEPGDVAVTYWGAKFYYVVSRSPYRAGDHVVEHGGTVAEWSDCDPDAAVYLVVDMAKAGRTPGVRDLDSLHTAVEDRRLLAEAAPESQLVLALDEFHELGQRGEWRGLYPYVREVSR